MAAEGLPFPRTQLTAFTCAVLGAAFGLALLAVIGFADGPATQHVRAFSEGGPGMLPLLVLAVVAPAVTAFGAIRMTRGRPVPILIFFFAALLPRLIGAVLGYVEGKKTDRALVGVVGDIVPRIAAEGTSEASRSIILGELVSAACLAVLAVGALGAIATIDIRHLATKTTPRDRLFSQATSACASAWFVASLALFASCVRNGELTNVRVVVLLAVAAFAFLATRVSRSSPALRASHDLHERRLHLGLGLLGALCALMATLFLEHALTVREDAYAFGAIAGESVDPRQRIHILQSAIGFRRYAGVALPLHAVLGTLTFGLATATAFGPRTTKKTGLPWRAVAVQVGVLAIFAVLAMERRTQVARLVIAGAAFDFARDIAAPGVVGLTDRRGVGDGRRLVITAGGAIREETPLMYDDAPDPSPQPRRLEGFDTSPSSRLEVMADERLTSASLVELLGAKGIHAFQLMVISTQSVEDGLPPIDPRPIGELGALVANGWLLGIDVDTQYTGAPVTAEMRSKDTLAVVFNIPGSAPTHVSTDLSNRTEAVRALRAAAATRGIGSQDLFQVAFCRECTVGDLARAITLLDGAFPAQQWPGRRVRVHASTP